jgi:hypothetical protein
VTLREYADALEKSRKPGDVAVGQYIRKHEVRLRGWVKDFRNGALGSEHEEILAACLLACVEAVQETDADAALKSVHNAMQRASRRAKVWQKRKVPFREEDET